MKTHRITRKYIVSAWTLKGVQLCLVKLETTHAMNEAALEREFGLVKNTCVVHKTIRVF